MKKLGISILIIMSIVLLSAEVSGEYGFQMLRIISGADIAAQAGNGSLTSEDGFGFLQNPAAGLINKNHVLSVTQNYWIFDTSLTNISYTNFLGKSSIGVAFRYLDYGTITSTDDVGDILGKFHPADITLSFNYARRLTPEHYVGVNINGLYQKIDTSSSLGLSLDLGYIYLTPIQDLELTASLKNLGKTEKMDNEDIALPVTAELSLVKAFQIKRIHIDSQVKLIKYVDDDNIRGSFGVMINPTSKLSLRAGYKMNFDSEDISLGIGLNLKKINFSYTYIPFDYYIDAVHMIGLAFKFE